MTKTIKDFEDMLINDLEIDVPRWIEQDIEVNQVRAIIQGGCSSGAYMPAVTYFTARQTMNEYGDEVLESLDGNIELGAEFLGQSWSGMAVYLLSCAVELWASYIENQLEEIENDLEDEGN